MLLKYGDMPFINQVVDIYNVISMESRLCVATHNLDKIDGNLTVRFSDGTEKYIPLGQDEPVPMPPMNTAIVMIPMRFYAGDLRYYSEILRREREGFLPGYVTRCFTILLASASGKDCNLYPVFV